MRKEDEERVVLEEAERVTLEEVEERVTLEEAERVTLKEVEERVTLKEVEERVTLDEKVGEKEDEVTEGMAKKVGLTPRTMRNLYFFRFNGFLISRQQGSTRNNRTALINQEAVKLLIEKTQDEDNIIVIYTPITRKSTSSIWKRIAKDNDIQHTRATLLTQDELGALNEFCIDMRSYLNIVMDKLKLKKEHVGEIHVFDYEKLIGMDDLGATYNECEEYRPSRIRPPLRN